MDGLSVEERLKRLNARIREACAGSGRDASEVSLLAVSKRQAEEKIRRAFASGQKCFAENYLQEAEEKMRQLADLPIEWHFIGRIQTNKIKQLARGFAAIHSVDRRAVAEMLNRQPVEGRQDVFLQFNVAAEASKGGADERGVETLLDFVVAECPRLRVLGLMVMPPLDGRSHLHFARSRGLLERLRGRLNGSARGRHPLDQLSMGTSGDFPAAIAEGSTWIRVGTDVFGPRGEDGEKT